MRWQCFTKPSIQSSWIIHVNTQIVVVVTDTQAGLQLNILSARTTCPFKCILIWQTRILTKQSYQKKFHSTLNLSAASYSNQVLVLTALSFSSFHFSKVATSFSPFLSGRAGTAAATEASFHTLYKLNSLQTKLSTSQTLYKPSTEVSCYLTSFTPTSQPRGVVLKCSC